MSDKFRFNNSPRLHTPLWWCLPFFVSIVLLTIVAYGDTWRGTAPFCDGECEPGEVVKGESNCGDGACCWTGHKVLCGNPQPLCPATSTQTACYGVVKICDNGFFEVPTGNWHSCNKYACGFCFGIGSTSSGVTVSDQWGAPWNGIWIKDSIQRSAVWGWSRTDFDRKATEMQADGFRPIMINAFINEGIEGWNGIWVKDGLPNTWVYGWSRTDFDRKAAEMQAAGFRPIMINAFSSGGQGWNGIWVKDGLPNTWVYGWSWPDFSQKANSLNGSEYSLLYLE